VFNRWTSLLPAIYLYAMYHLPNRDYYAQLHGMNEEALVQTLQNVLFYCSLQLVSLLLLFFALQTKLGFSPVHHLAFVLDKQCVGVQVKLVFWVYYNAQASLAHSGESAPARDHFRGAANISCALVYWARLRLYLQVSLVVAVPSD
jgi:hypothetical protein